MPARFTGKVVIVTGSSNGIGRETAKLFAEEGAKVTITGRSETALEETFNLLISAGASPASVLKIAGNIMEDEVQKRIVDETVAKFGKLDMLINNAGALGPDNTQSTGFDLSTDVYDYIMNLNLKTVLTLTKLALPHLSKSKGEVVNVSSIVAMPFANTGGPYYSVSKAGLDQLTRSMAVSFMKQGVRVNSVNPGWIVTEFMRKHGVTPEIEKHLIETNAKNSKFIPIGRPGEPRDIANMIAFLSDRSQSEYVVGQCLVVDGGCCLQNALFVAHQQD